MDIKQLTQQLINNRLMRTVEEFETFEKVSAKIIELKDINHIPNLCMGFHDETECHEVMFGLIHGVEYYEKVFSTKEYLEQLLNSIELMIPHAQEWAIILNRRILRCEDDSYKIYKDLIKESNNNIKTIILKLLIEIKDDNPEIFSEKVDEIILYINNSKVNNNK